ATALFCAVRGAHVTATDLRGESEIAESAKLRANAIALRLGQHDLSILDRQDLVITSPGVSADAPILAAARAKGIAVWSEIELASRFLRDDCTLVGITGSNGKTTTTTLIAHILATAGMRTQIAGNIGTPLISLIDQIEKGSNVVAELSSFQLELTESFRPNIAVFLNLTPDHLDRHGSLDAYAHAKARIFTNQLPSDAAVLNADDPATVKLAPTRPDVHWFSRQKAVDH